MVITRRVYCSPIITCYTHLISVRFYHFLCHGVLWIFTQKCTHTCAHSHTKLYINIAQKSWNTSFELNYSCSDDENDDATTVQKMKFPIKNFFSKCEQIRSLPLTSIRETFVISTYSVNTLINFNVLFLWLVNFIRFPKNLFSC